MQAKSKTSRDRTLIRVQIARREMGLSDLAYRDVLRRAARKRSSKSMSQHELNRVLLEFYRMGWQPKLKDSPNHGRPANWHVDSRNPMYGKIYALMCDNNWSWAYVRGTVNKMFGHDNVARSLEFLDLSDLHKLVAALQIHANRLAVRKPGATAP